MSDGLDWETRWALLHDEIVNARTTVMSNISAEDSERTQNSLRDKGVAFDYVLRFMADLTRERGPRA